MSQISNEAVRILSGISGSLITFDDFTDVTVFVGIVECVFKGGGLGVSKKALTEPDNRDRWIPDCERNGITGKLCL